MATMVISLTGVGPPKQISPNAEYADAMEVNAVRVGSCKTNDPRPKISRRLGAMDAPSQQNTFCPGV